MKEKIYDASANFRITFHKATTLSGRICTMITVKFWQNTKNQWEYGNLPVIESRNLVQRDWSAKRDPRERGRPETKRDRKRPSDEQNKEQR